MGATQHDGLQKNALMILKVYPPLTKPIKSNDIHSKIRNLSLGKSYTLCSEHNKNEVANDTNFCPFFYAFVGKGH